MIVGHGVDVVDVARFARSLARTPSLATRLFTPDELAVTAVERLAARFAAKEAVAKALRHPWAGGWHDVEVVGARAPRLVVRGGVLTAAEGLGVTGWHLSLSHDGGVAVASVIAEGGQA